MHEDFWHKRWQENQIGFHQAEVNALLRRHFAALKLPATPRVFVPLCGKTLDIAWLRAQGVMVVGVELSTLAVNQLFDDMQLEPAISTDGALTHYSAQSEPTLGIYVGDVFKLSGEMLGAVNATYDRAALVALPEDMRQTYVRHVIKITAKAPQLMLTFTYDPDIMEGPPFSISGPEMHTYFESDYGVDLLEQKEVVEGLKGFCPAMENIWHLHRYIWHLHR